MIVASAPVVAAPSGDAIGFESFLNHLLPECNQLHQTPDYALQSGVCLYMLVEYAAGVCNKDDRPLLNEWLISYPWAMQVVVALVKGSRIKNSKAARLLQQARNLPDEDALLIALCNIERNTESDKGQSGEFRLVA